MGMEMRPSPSQASSCSSDCRSTRGRCCMYDPQNTPCSVAFFTSAMFELICGTLKLLVMCTQLVQSPNE